MAESMDLSRLPERFRNKITIDPETGCWLWAKPDHEGYGHASLKGRQMVAHRAVWILLVGPIPVGLVLDHLCRVRSCVNPLHLEPVTLEENNRRGGLARRKDVCGRGHSMEGENVGQSPNGVRYCKECAKISRAAWQASNIDRITEYRRAYNAKPEVRWQRRQRAATPEYQRRNRENARRMRAKRFKPGPGQGSLF